MLPEPNHFEKPFFVLNRRDRKLLAGFMMQTQVMPVAFMYQDFFGTRGIFKSQIVFEMPQAFAIGANLDLPYDTQDLMTDENLVNVFPISARDIINVEFPDAFVDT